MVRGSFSLGQLVERFRGYPLLYETIDKHKRRENPRFIFSLHVLRDFGDEIFFCTRLLTAGHDASSASVSQRARCKTSMRTPPPAPAQPRPVDQLPAAHAEAFADARHLGG